MTYQPVVMSPEEQWAALIATLNNWKVHATQLTTECAGKDVIIQQRDVAIDQLQCKVIALTAFVENEQSITRDTKLETGLRKDSYIEELHSYIEELRSKIVELTDKVGNEHSRVVGLMRETKLHSQAMFRERDMLLYKVESFSTTISDNVQVISNLEARIGRMFVEITQLEKRRSERSDHISVLVNDKVRLVDEIRRNGVKNDAKLSLLLNLQKVTAVPECLHAIQVSDTDMDRVFPQTVLQPTHEEELPFNIPMSEVLSDVSDIFKLPEVAPPLLNTVNDITGYKRPRDEVLPIKRMVLKKKKKNKKKKKKVAYGPLCTQCNGCCDWIQSNEEYTSLQLTNGAAMCRHKFCTRCTQGMRETGVCAVCDRQFGKLVVNCYV